MIWMHRRNQADQAATDQAKNDAGTDGVAPNEQADLKELSKSADEQAAGTQATQDAAKGADAAPGDSKEDLAMLGLGDAPADTTAPAAAVPPTPEAAVGGTPDAPAVVPPTTDEALNLGLDTAPPTTNPEVVEKKPEEAPITAKQDEAPSVTPSVPASPVIDGEKRPHKRSAGGYSRVPRIPRTAKKVKGTNLNRFYFVRKGDNSKKVSELIYGSNDKAKLLTKWNGAHWTPGSLMFYSSPVDPNDKTMHSFYQEKNVTAEEYTIQKGDWLSKDRPKEIGKPPKLERDCSDQRNG